MNIFQTDGFKIGVVVTLALLLVFFIANTFVMQTFTSIGKMQDRNDALHTRTTSILIKHKRVKLIMRQLQIAEEVTLVTNYITSVAYNIQPVTIKNIAANIVTHSTATEVPIALTVAVIQTLSNFNPTTVGKNNNRGLFQRNTLHLPRSTEGDLRRKLHDINQNITIGTAALSECIKMYPNDIAGALDRFIRSEQKDIFIRNVTNNLLTYSVFRDNGLKVFRKNINTPKIIGIATKQLLAEAKVKQLLVKAKATKGD